MKQAVTVYIVALSALHVSYLLQGFAGTAETAYGALTIMAAMISAIFLWLWAMRLSPLPLGMAISWAGVGLVMGWWWLYTRLDGPVWMLRSENLLVLLAALLSGAVLHFEVLETSFRLRRGAFLIPVVGAVALSAVLVLAG